MRAAFITEPGPPEAIQVGELPVPVPGSTDVLVAVEGSAVNPADPFIRSKRYPTPMPLPFVGAWGSTPLESWRGAGSGSVEYTVPLSLSGCLAKQPADCARVAIPAHNRPQAQ